MFIIDPVRMSGDGRCWSDVVSNMQQVTHNFGWQADSISKQILERTPSLTLNDCRAAMALASGALDRRE
jgi:hypothetical protein